MSKRSEIRARRRRHQIRKQITLIVLVSVGALFIATALILPSILDEPYEPRVFGVPVEMTTGGFSDAPIVIESWVDFQCSACARFSEEVETKIIEDYVETGIASYTFRHFPFLDGADNPEFGADRLHYVSSEYGLGKSDMAANASMCAGAQGLFWDYHDYLFYELAGAYSEGNLIDLAKKLDLDIREFRACLSENRYEEEIQSDYETGVARGVSGTPSIFVNGVRVVSPQGDNYVPTYNDIVSAIEASLAGD
jgi:protein-disulfide isomerase